MQTSQINYSIRLANQADEEAVWEIIAPVIQAGETFALSQEMTREEALGFWFMPEHEVFVALNQVNEIVGTYYLQPNKKGGGAHIGNCGYATSAQSSGKGVASAMCAHSIERAKERGFRAVQFNFVVSTNVRAVKLWEKFGFQIIATLPEAFHHPKLGFVDSYIMFRKL